MTSLDPEILRAYLGELPVEISQDAGDGLRLMGDASRSLELLSRLRDGEKTSMRRLVDLCAIDRGGKAGRFEVVYRLHSPAGNARVRVHFALDEEDPTIDSVAELWPAADWLEREVFDLFGIDFRGHPNLRRILLDDEFEGAPLRKDYPRQPDLVPPRDSPR